MAADLPHLVATEPIITAADRLGMTVFVAIVAHLVVILGVVFVPYERPESLFSTLDIVLVSKETRTAPVDANLLAQANQDGGGNADEEARPATPLPAPFVSEEAAVIAGTPPVEVVEAQPVEQVTVEQPVEETQPSEAQPVLALVNEQATSALSPPSDLAPRPKTKPAVPTTRVVEVDEQATPEAINAATLINRSLTMASLSAEIDQRLVAYAERPRRKWISARTREFKYASYMEAWRLKVERIGNLNYPDEARRNKLAGHLLLEVALNPNGSINDIVLRRSSGHRLLDDAAIRIVKLSAPFAPLPDAILNDTDILHIERTWRFLNTSQFSGS